MTKGSSSPRGTTRKLHGTRNLQNRREAELLRENLRRRNKEPLESIINMSINQTLSRTLLTSGTTLMMVLALQFLGGEIIHDFALALTIGIAAGTYSSIFIASVFLVLWDMRVNPKRA